MNSPEQPKDDGGEAASPVVETSVWLEQERRALLDALASSKPGTVVQKVGWILNNYPDTRNSDITLQLRYWETFCSDQYDRNAITEEDLYKLPRLTSLTRARARVQNTLKLFLADAEVRKHRGTLSEEERDEAVAAKLSSAPVYAVYVDESGKTQRYLVVGSLWILQGPEAFRIATKLIQWRDTSGFREELHFAEVNERSLPYYKKAVDAVVDNASALSLKYVAIPRAGAGSVQDVVPKLIYYLVVRSSAASWLLTSSKPRTRRATTYCRSLTCLGPRSTGWSTLPTRHRRFLARRTSLLTLCSDTDGGRAYRRGRRSLRRSGSQDQPVRLGVG